MRDIHVSDDITVLFPNRPEGFDAGFEVGGLAALMAIPINRFSRRLSASTLRAATRLAADLGYGVTSRPDEPDSRGGETLLVTFARLPVRPQAPGRPKLSLVGGPSRQ